MTGAALALTSAVCFGVADYAGGLLSRRASAGAVACLVQVTGAVLMLLAALLVPAVRMGRADLAWGALSGVGTAVGLFFLYRGVTRGHMSVVVPLSTVGAVVLPVLAGVGLMNEEPSLLSWLGIAVAVPAIALVSGAGGPVPRGGRPAVADALVSSVGFALQYVALAQTTSDSGLWPVTSGRFGSVATMVVLAATLGSGLRLPPRLFVPTALNGALAAAGLTAYMLATRHDIMSVAVVLSSLYPVIPVLLGLTVLRERLSATQTLGLAGAAVTVVLLTSG